MMKNLFLISFGFSMILVLSACGGKDSSHENTNETPAPSAEPTASPVGKNNPGPVQAPPVCDSSGPIGDYSGYVTASDGSSIVPLTLNIDINKGPSTTGSQTKASLRVGLFGGVSIGTDIAVYTFQDGGFTATFAPATTGGTAFKLSGKINCGVFVGAVLQGKMASYAVTLSKGTKSPFANGRPAFKYDMVFPNVSKSVRGVMTIGRLNGTIASSDFSDLPTIPYLKATFQFDNHTPIVADTAQYDPLRGVLEISMNNNVSFVKCGSVNLKQWAGDLEVPQYFASDKTKTVTVGLECEVTAGGAIPQKLVAASNEGRILPVSPEYYVGQWKPVNKNVNQFTVVGDVTYTGVDGSNPPGYLFPKFPILLAKLYACNEGAFSQQITLYSQAIDQVTGKAIFGTAAPSASGTTLGSNTEYYQPSYSFGWGSVSGQLVTTNSGELGSPTISLEPYKGNWQGCNIPTKK